MNAGGAGPGPRSAPGAGQPDPSTVPINRAENAVARGAPPVVATRGRGAAAPGADGAPPVTTERSPVVDADPVVVEHDGRVAIVSLNRPHRHNAANDAMDERFWDILEELHHRPDVRCLVIRGEGKSLSSGR